MAMPLLPFLYIVGTTFRDPSNQDRAPRAQPVGGKALTIANMPGGAALSAKGIPSFRLKDGLWLCPIDYPDNLLLRRQDKAGTETLGELNIRRFFLDWAKTNDQLAEFLGDEYGAELDQVLPWKADSWLAVCSISYSQGNAWDPGYYGQFLARLTLNPPSLEWIGKIGRMYDGSLSFWRPARIAHVGKQMWVVLPNGVAEVGKNGRLGAAYGPLAPFKSVVVPWQTSGGRYLTIQILEEEGFAQKGSNYRTFDTWRHRWLKPGEKPR